MVGFRVLLLLISGAGLLFCSGCTLLSPAAVEWADAEVSAVWPSPPDPPRLRYLRSLSGAADFAEKGKSGRFFRWLTGEADRGVPLVSPYGVAADGQGRVWVADMGVAAVHVIDLARRRVEYIVQAGNTFLVSPVGVALDLFRNMLYISDAGLNKVFVFDLDGRYIGERTGLAAFGRPAGLAVDAAGQLYVVDVVKSQVDIFSPDGGYLRSLKSAAPPDREFKLPSNVAVAADGSVFVVDSMNFRLEVFDAEGRSQRTIGLLGDVPGTFARPRGIALDADGHIYVADAVLDNVQIFDRDGKLLLFFGGRGKAAGEFSLPSGLFFDQFNRLYVADVYNQRIQVFQPMAVAK
ncbi:MAG: hypothetical protein A2091_03415 [Desulfuromonadales bacterium GWD2_61_12]|nr:MAG: hypothetical protein A2005_06265 [Desulfuromonadales bacterium GWC2_61_20]OGR34951.1 MAG: hypothetical protein A2091_03415 [Desulfuromonadales bacterium GWD2_61_12]HAD04442.1 6-bladed beta-propeller [Desulfuromonas sp.]